MTNDLPARACQKNYPQSIDMYSGHKLENIDRPEEENTIRYK